MKKAENAVPCAPRLEQFRKTLKKRRIDIAIVRDQANVRALTGIDCDNALLAVCADGAAVFHTDFRYIPMAHRVAPWLETRDIKKFELRAFAKAAGIRAKGLRAGYESNMKVSQFEELKKKGPANAKYVDIYKDVLGIRAVKTEEEIEKLAAAARLNDEIWKTARASFRPGMTEKDMARAIRHLMIDRGDGEAFDTIVCVGKNAAECHHVPDDTVWDGKEPVLVDMGVKLDGYCSDMTRNIVPRKGASAKYREVYEAVLAANRAAIAAARPGIAASALDKVARDVLAKRGLGKAFGHSLGHGVGLEIHEAPVVAQKSKAVLAEGMVHSIEPGVYLEGELGVRIEDLVLICKDGCRVLSHSEK